MPLFPRRLAGRHRIPESRIKVRAAVLRQIGLPPSCRDSRPLAIDTVDLAPPGRDEVLVRIRAAGLCHSGLSVINGDRPRPVPMALGHLAAGAVAGLGEGVHDLRIGDPVALVARWIKVESSESLSCRMAGQKCCASQDRQPP